MLDELASTRPAERGLINVILHENVTRCVLGYTITEFSIDSIQTAKLGSKLTSTFLTTALNWIT